MYDINFKFSTSNLKPQTSNLSTLDLVRLRDEGFALGLDDREGDRARRHAHRPRHLRPDDRPHPQGRARRQTRTLAAHCRGCRPSVGRRLAPRNLRSGGFQGRAAACARNDLFHRSARDATGSALGRSRGVTGEGQG